MSYLRIQGEYLSHERFIYCFERERKEGECPSCTDHCLTLIRNNHHATEAHFEAAYAMAPHSSTLAWKIPWTEEPGGLQSMGSLRVGHD